ncbi:hypothetical protein [Massilia pseudoviolaceinigra]|nr:hypothetical protein [Massilia sp. CCM 9206]MDQ1923143.1 hypothetical protein [Massilia sp. CCM 9206]
MAKSIILSMAYVLDEADLSKNQVELRKIGAFIAAGQIMNLMTQKSEG